MGLLLPKLLLWLHLPTRLALAAHLWLDVVVMELGPPALSRARERQADTLGRVLATRACYDPRDSVMLWEKRRLQVESLAGSCVFVSS